MKAVTFQVRLLQALSLCLLLLFTLPLLLPGESSIGWWAMQVLPLLLLLPRLHQPRRRPLQWLGFLVLFYFTAGVLQLFEASTLSRWLGAGTVLCCCVLFVAAIVRARTLVRPTE
jgi:uncharacterized membrane protein